jgi:hypothetical protein
MSIVVTPQVTRVTVAPGGGTGVAKLDDLSDVRMTGLANGYVLRYDGTEWLSVPSSSWFAAASHTHAQTDITGLSTQFTVIATQINDINDLLGGLPPFGNAAELDANLSGDAGALQVVLGNDSRLTNARTPTTHTHPSTAITDVTTVGRALMTSATESAARTVLQLGSAAQAPSSTFATAVHTHAGTDIVSGKVGVAYLPTGTTGSDVCIGNDSRLSDSRAPNGTATGDLYGSYPSPNVGKLRGVALSSTAPTGGQILKYNGTSTQWEPASASAPTISSAQNIASATVACTAATWNLAGARLTLGAGTWLINSTITVSHTSSTEVCAFRIANNDSTPTVYASTEQRTAASADNMNATMTVIVTLSATKSIGHEVRSPNSGTTVQISTSSTNGSSAYATILNAIQIG